MRGWSELETAFQDLLNQEGHGEEWYDGVTTAQDVLIRWRIHWTTSCPAVIHHGPGHQSRTPCDVKGPHTEHHVFLWGGTHEGDYEWTGDGKYFA